MSPTAYNFLSKLCSIPTVVSVDSWHVALAACWCRSGVWGMQKWLAEGTLVTSLAPYLRARAPPLEPLPLSSPNLESSCPSVNPPSRHPPPLLYDMDTCIVCLGDLRTVAEEPPPSEPHAPSPAEASGDLNAKTIGGRANAQRYTPR